MGKHIDLTGQKFGRLKVLGPTKHNKHWKIVWLCRCDCGNLLWVETGHLKARITKSCGCLREENSRWLIKKAQKKRWPKPPKQNIQLDYK